MPPLRPQRRRGRGGWCRSEQELLPSVALPAPCFLPRDLTHPLRLAHKDGVDPTLQVVLRTAPGRRVPPFVRGARFVQAEQCRSLDCSVFFRRHQALLDWRLTRQLAADAEGVLPKPSDRAARDLQW